MNKVTCCQRVVTHQLFAVRTQNLTMQLLIFLSKEQSLLRIQEGELHLRLIRYDEMLGRLINALRIVVSMHIKLSHKAILC